MINLAEIARAYTEACEKIETLIRESKYKITYIMEEVGLGRAAFYARLNKRNWEPSHLLIFARLLQPERTNGGQ
jgi:hypothetical protein